jgi:SAM-dependent methyltransferase
MRHREIYAAIHAFVQANHPQPFSLLDLGCGDAGFIVPTFSDTHLANYAGVDASAAALKEARRNLATSDFGVTLVEGDLLDYVANASSREHCAYDLILAGYSVHHLSSEDKQRFFARCREVVAPAGALLFYDLFRRPGESRGSWVAAYTAMIKNEWGLVGEALENTCRHVRERDHPETLEATERLARQAGFVAHGLRLYSDADGFHGLLSFGA